MYIFNCQEVIKILVSIPPRGKGTIRQKNPYLCIVTYLTYRHIHPSSDGFVFLTKIPGKPSLIDAGEALHGGPDLRIALEDSGAIFIYVEPDGHELHLSVGRVREGHFAVGAVRARKLERNVFLEFLAGHELAHLDDEVIQAADEANIAMVFTGCRVFRHG